MITEVKEGLNPALDSLRSMSLDKFRKRYSPDNPEIDSFDMDSVYAGSNESVSADLFAKLSMQRGIHLSVAGGLDAPLGQVAHMQPDLSLLCDPNTYATYMIQTRLNLLDKSRDGRQYWTQFDYLLGSDPGLGSSIKPDLVGSDYLFGGWSSFERFPLVQKAWQEGVIKFINADITTDGIQTAMEIAKGTGLSVGLINLSNIFDYRVNRNMLRRFKSTLSLGISDGTINNDAKVVTSSKHDGLKHTIWPVMDFADPRRSLI